jgi:UDP-2,4-diacetamido-2,4,6-trideoxy-beta-L-altropyranose hydrolase
VSAPRVVFRADASARIGTGHVMRCATLGEELQSRGWAPILASRVLPLSLRRRLEASGMRVLDLPADVPLDREPSVIGEQLDPAETGPVLVITDHYDVGARWHLNATWATALAAIDDLANREQHVALLVNQNLGATRARYAGLVPPGANLLLGPRYALVRPEFAEARRASAAVRVPRRDRSPRVLVIMGGADESDVTGRAAAAATSIGTTLDVVVGAAYPHAQRLRAWADGRRGVKVHVDTPDVAELMVQADVCIGAAGSATWERCTLGLPALLVTLAQNQVEVASLLTREGAAVSLGWHEDVTAMDVADALRSLLADPDQLRSMSRAAARITDGNGTRRVADAIERLALVPGPSARTRGTS